MNYFEKWGVKMKDELREQLKYCRLAGILERYDDILQEAKRNDWDNERFFETLIQCEVLSRGNNRFQRLLHQAKFPNLKTIDQFDFSQAPYLSKKEILELSQCKFIEEKTNLLFLGSPGAGKTHISIAIGIQACKKGKTVSFFTAANLGNLLVEMQEERQLTKFQKKLSKVDLLIIDELGYVQLSDQVTQLMFQIFSERYEKGSILVNSNLEFAEWAKIFHDERMTAAIIDRLIHNSKIILFNGESYRYRNQRREIQQK
jgi:DNA replication protein DnaC